MIKIAVAAALAAIVIADAARVPAATPAGVTIERPRGLKGDRLQISPQAPGCTDAVWPNYSGRMRRQPPAAVRHAVVPHRAVRLSRATGGPVMTRLYIHAAAAAVGDLARRLRLRRAARLCAVVCPAAAAAVPAGDAAARHL